ncbi:MAG TPA: universal stress protein [Desulfuromonadales bacterium]|nr:universal stress protein [Desulfuromonadales bacterium]
MEMFHRILVISRMNAYSRKAITVGVSLALKYNAKLHVLHLVSNPVNLMTMNSSGLFPEAQYTDYFNSQQEAKKQLAKVIRQEQRHGIAIQEMVSERDSVEEIVKVVTEANIDLLVMPAHEEGLIEHALFGGENDAIIRMMPCSIMLVKTKLEHVAW